MSQVSPLPRHRVPLPWDLFSKILEGKKAEVLRASRLSWLTPKYRPSRGFKRRLFERFTEEATKAIMLAEEESRRLTHVGVGTDAILLGLLLATETIASKVLGSMRINPKDVKVEADKISGRYTTPIQVEKRTEIAPIRFSFTDPALRLLELTYEEARKLGHNYIGSGHLLLGLLSDEGCLAARVLAKLGANASDIRTEVIRMIGENNNETILELSSYQPTVEDVAKVDEEIKALENEQSQMSKESHEAFAGRDFKKGILLGNRKHAIGREISALVNKRITLSMWT